ncbi:prepilin peptidase [Streptobacillus moniliformis]|uniref:prepilin peptidase n=1 Tax=Streptobacillus moniliformis TaxID=34105 RepID=UPI0007E469FB|nr:prepilin peptidase [Streptobacillus moniliformis]
MIYAAYLMLLYISYVDFVEGYIYDRDLVILFIFLYFSTTSGIYSSYVGMGIFSLPFFILWILESYFNFEIIGMGDIKLMLIFGMYFGIKDMHFIFTFYEMMYFSSLIYAIILRKKYVPFAPAMCFSFIIHDLGIFN